MRQNAKYLGKTKEGGVNVYSDGITLFAVYNEGDATCESFTDAKIADVVENLEQYMFTPFIEFV